MSFGNPHAVNLTLVLSLYKPDVCSADVCLHLALIKIGGDVSFEIRTCFIHSHDALWVFVFVFSIPLLVILLGNSS